MRDRTNLILIGFIVIFGMSAALLATGIIPTIIDTVNVANQTKHESINQTAILQDFVTLYLANTKNDTKEALEALASARESILNQEQLIIENKKSVQNQEKILRENKNITEDLLNVSIDQEKILNENRNITKDIFEISQEHMRQQEYHDAQQKLGDDLVAKINNVTQLSYELLAGHTKNVTEAQIEEETINQSGGR